MAITAGTPEEFATRNVGVELKVTPTVEEDDYSISLDLNPKVPAVYASKKLEE